MNWMDEVKHLFLRGGTIMLIIAIMLDNGHVQ